MRISIPKFRDFDNAHHRGETRWTANWYRLLEAAGHEIASTSTELVISAPWERNEIFKNFPHVHVHFGPLTQQLVDDHLKCWGDNCYVASPYEKGVTDDPNLVKKNIFLPFPYSDTWLPEMDSPSDRKKITWTAKEVWHRELGQRSSYIPKCAIMVLETLVEILPGTDFEFNLVQCAETGSNFASAPEEARRLLAEIPNKKVVGNSLGFNEFIKLMSQSRLSLCVGGCCGGILESIFTKSVPMAHKGMVFGGRAEERGLVLPYAAGVTKEEIKEKLQQLLFDDDYYWKVWTCYQTEFEPHRAENSMQYFNKFIKENL